MYGVLIFAGIFVSTLVGERLCKKRNLDLEPYWKAICIGVVLGLVGARFYHVASRADYFIERPIEILTLWQGGLGIWGGIMGGLLGVYLPIRKSGRVFEYLDVFAVCAPLAQAIGRWGNFFNKEVFGLPTTLPWGLYIPIQLRPANFLYFDYFHPLFLYESIIDLLLFLILFKVYGQSHLIKRHLSIGMITLCYLVGYSIIRFFLEFLRLKPWTIFGLPVAGIVSLVVFVFCFSAILIKVRIPVR